jgi:glucosylceramidase
MEPLPKYCRHSTLARRLLGLAALFVTLTVSARPWEVWITDRDGAQPLHRAADLRWQSAPASDSAVVTINPAARQQDFLGVGAAMTDASAALINQRLLGPARRAFLREVFDPRAGLGLDLMRVTIGGSDFSQRHYSLDDTDGNRADPTLQSYADAPETIEVRQLMREARAMNGQLRIIASPWSAPAWMKSSGSLISGRLLEDYYGAFASYLLRFADGYAAAGIPLYALTVQNEPAYEAPTYASMRVDADARARFIADFLGPRLAQRPGGPLLLEWDHNWSQPGSPLATLAHPQAARFVQGVAWHCYGGSPQVQTWVRAAVPGKDAYITECSGGDWQKEWPETFRSMVGTVVIGGIRAGARAVVLWNLALNEEHGPHIGGCNNCRGLVTIDAQGQIIRHAEYYALAHIARFVRPGASVIESTSSSEDLRSVAFRDPASHRLTVLLQNAGAEGLDLTLGLGPRTARLHLDAGSVATVTGFE